MQVDCSRSEVVAKQMAALTTAQEYQAIREAIQLFSTGRTTASVTVDGMTITYMASQMADLQRREEVLLRRLSIRNVRKRTQPDFS